MTNPWKNVINVDDALYGYILRMGVREHPVLTRLRERTAQHELGGMQMTSDQGAFLQLLLKLIGARRTIEVGVFTGTSALATALALPDDGYILACDFRRALTSIGEPYWEEAGVRNKIDLHLAPAAESLAKEIEAGRKGTYDFAFIDADKENYLTYYEQCLRLVRPGGLIAVDNVLWMGSVADNADDRPTTVEIRKLNDLIRNDERVDISMIPIADGMTLVRKR
jgi:predicted O-methyltransferase YrrM